MDVVLSFDESLYIDYFNMIIAICSVFIKHVYHFIDAEQSKFTKAERMGLSDSSADSEKR